MRTTALSISVLALACALQACGNSASSARDDALVPPAFDGPLGQPNATPSNLEPGVQPASAATTTPSADEGTPNVQQLNPASAPSTGETPATNTAMEGPPAVTGPVAAGVDPAQTGGDDTGGGTGPCDFASGLNVAWVNFAQDVPNPDLATFRTIFQNAHDAGGRVVRWWFHTNGTVTPGYNADGTVKKIEQSHIDGVKAILAAANSAGVAVNISLWSFDMAQDNAGSAAANNKNLLTQDSVRQSYIDNYLTPLVTALKGTPGLYSYEIFNEPEGMSTTGWATQWKIDISYIQKAVNQWSAAIHAADPTVLVTNGSQTMDYRTKYTDGALMAAGGEPTGTLNFYEVHYYPSNGQGNNVFANDRSHWGLSDKPLVIGEFSIDGTSPVSSNQSYTYLYDQGYDGAWAWAYTADDKWPSMQVPMQSLYGAHSDVGDCP